MKLLKTATLALALSLSIALIYNPDLLGITPYNALSIALASISVPLARFTVTFLWNIAILPIYSNIRSSKIRSIIKLVFAPPGK